MFSRFFFWILEFNAFLKQNFRFALDFLDRYLIRSNYFLNYPRLFTFLFNVQILFIKLILFLQSQRTYASDRIAQLGFFAQFLRMRFQLALPIKVDLA